MHRRLRILNVLAARRIMKQFATRNDLVYFGNVDKHDDEYELVRGATVSTTHADSHYTVGAVAGRDVIVVERSNTLTLPGTKPTRHRWLIMQIDLHRHKLPHVFVDAHQHDEHFYETLFMHLPRFQDLSHMFVAGDAQFARHCKVFGLPQQYAEIQEVLTPQITRPLAQHFRQFDYEVQDDRLYVYASKTRLTLAVLQDMLRAGMWLAEQLDNVAATS